MKDWAGGLLPTVHSFHSSACELYCGKKPVGRSVHQLTINRPKAARKPVYRSAAIWTEMYPKFGKPTPKVARAHPVLFRPAELPSLNRLLSGVIKISEGPTLKSGVIKKDGDQSSAASQRQGILRKNLGCGRKSLALPSQQRGFHGLGRWRLPRGCSDLCVFGVSALFISFTQALQQVVSVPACGIAITSLVFSIFLYNKEQSARVQAGMITISVQPYSSFHAKRYCSAER